MSFHIQWSLAFNKQKAWGKKGTRTREGARDMADENSGGLIRFSFHSETEDDGRIDRIDAAILNESKNIMLQRIG